MALALVYAIVAALFLGGSDFFAARSSRTMPSVTVTRTMVVVSTMLSPILLLLVDFEWIARDVLIGAGSGLAMTSGLLLAYRGYRVSRIGVVAPISSVLLAAVPVVVDLIGGDRPSGLATSGMAVGLVALVLTSYQPGGAGSMRQGVQLGIAAGICYGIAFTLMGEVSDAAGLLPVIAQRTTGSTMLLIVFAFGSSPLFTSGPARRWSLAAGCAAITAIATLQIAFQKGDSGPVSVAGSQFATVAVLLSVAFNRERMRWWQGMGVAATAVGVSLMALGT
jgi:drug/metabolite transporter (DMT)-like permease